MKNRVGFTLIEVVLALTILLVVMVSLVTLTAKVVHVTATSDREQSAIQMAMDRTDQVRADPDYAGLDTMYAKTESGFPTLLGFIRTTAIVRTTTSNHDYRRVTVQVTGPGLLGPIKRTVTVAAP